MTAVIDTSRKHGNHGRFSQTFDRPPIRRDNRSDVQTLSHTKEGLEPIPSNLQSSSGNLGSKSQLHQKSLCHSVYDSCLGVGPFILVSCLFVLLTVCEHPFEQHSRYGQACCPPSLNHLLTAYCGAQLGAVRSARRVATHKRFEYC